MRKKKIVIQAVSVLIGLVFGYYSTSLPMLPKYVHEYYNAGLLSKYWFFMFSNYWWLMLIAFIIGYSLIYFIASFVFKKK